MEMRFLWVGLFVCFYLLMVVYGQGVEKNERIFSSLYNLYCQIEEKHSVEF